MLAESFTAAGDLGHCFAVYLYTNARNRHLAATPDVCFSACWDSTQLLLNSPLSGGWLRVCFPNTVAPAEQKQADLAPLKEPEN